MISNPLADQLKQYDVVLGSNSPRRKELLKETGISFRVETREVDETPPALRHEDVAMFLARKKANAFLSSISDNTLVITADTIVSAEGELLGKPKDAADAERMLELLSGKKHQVMTGVCLFTQKKSDCFFVKTDVAFRKLSDDEIQYYIDVFKPFDKAGAYGIQEWIGMIGIEYIQGSYFNVMGLPVSELYAHLMRF